MALNAVTAAIAFLLAASTVSMVTVGSISLVKTIKAEKQWTAIDTKLEAVKNSSGMSSLEESIDQNNEKNKEDQKKQKAQIDLINTKEQLKQDIKDLQAQIEQTQRDLGTAKTQKTKLEKAINTLNEMKVELDAAFVAADTNANIAARLDRNLWTPLINAAGALLYNNAGGGDVAGHMDDILDACANVNGRRDGNNLGAAVLLKQVIELLADRQADAVTAAGAARRAIGAEKMVARNFLTGTFRPELQQQIADIKKYKKAIAKHTADLKTKENELAALQKKNK